MLTITTTTEFNVSDEQLDSIATDLLTTAVEGGINYWAVVNSYKWDTEIVADRHATVQDGDDESEPEVTVTVAKLREAMVRLLAGGFKPFYTGGYDEPYSERLRSALVEMSRGVDISYTDYDYDAGDADCMFQLAAYGEVIFG